MRAIPMAPPTSSILPVVLFSKKRKSATRERSKPKVKNTLCHGPGKAIRIKEGIKAIFLGISRFPIQKTMTPLRRRKNISMTLETSRFTPNILKRSARRK